MARPISTCCACVVKGDRLLLIERANEPSKGNWSFPGGRIELGETILEATRREVREETGLEIEPLALFQVYDHIVRDDASAIQFHYIVHYVRAAYLHGELHAQDDATQASWVTESELAHLPMHPFVRETAVRLLRGTGASAEDSAHACAPDPSR